MYHLYLHSNTFNLKIIFFTFLKSRPLNNDNVYFQIIRSTLQHENSLASEACISITGEWRSQKWPTFCNQEYLEVPSTGAYYIQPWLLESFIQKHFVFELIISMRPQERLYFSKVNHYLIIIFIIILKISVFCKYHTFTPWWLSQQRISLPMPETQV